ncbi:hypothetical protein P167DRAFT_270036 [Morchella conica CCBAS932]|uniref:Uncharacterized protein n=1 Tax=Morchella conica CCBAS932 TaxID=1392247 RepID=A0A3N4KLH3_9PEZI|nr:hypothetical protein P167DRAFT_270036 [Morchella conica CCBAS932]
MAPNIYLELKVNRIANTNLYRLSKDAAPPMRSKIIYSGVIYIASNNGWLVLLYVRTCRAGRLAGVSRRYVYGTLLLRSTWLGFMSGKIRFLARLSRRWRISFGKL